MQNNKVDENNKKDDEQNKKVEDKEIIEKSEEIVQIQESESENKVEKDGDSKKVVLKGLKAHGKFKVNTTVKVPMVDINVKAEVDTGIEKPEKSKGCEIL